MHEALRLFVPEDLSTEIEELAATVSSASTLREMSDRDFEAIGDRFREACRRADESIEINKQKEDMPRHFEQAVGERQTFATEVARGLMFEAARREAAASQERSDRLRAGWLTSDERKRSRRAGFIGIALIVSGVAILVVCGIVFSVSGEANEIAVTLGATLGGVTFVIGSIVVGTARVEGKRAFEAKTRLAELNAETVRTAQALSEALDDPTRLIAYWTSTQQRLDKFHADARGQLRSAYLLSQGSAVLGYLVVLVLGVVAAFATSTTSTLVVGGIAAVAGALSGYVSHTFQVTYDRALRQTMTYFEQPVIASRLLHGERLLAQFTEGSEARDEALLVLVRAATKVKEEDPSS